MASPELYAVLYVLSGVVSLGVAAWVWGRRDHRGARAFIALLFVIAIWTFVDAIAVATADTFEQWMLWQKVRWTVMAFVPALWLLFTIRYTNLYAEYARPASTLLFAEATVVAALTLTNDVHELVWELEGATPHGVPTIQTVGPAFVGHMFVTSWLVLGGIVLLLQVLLNARDAHRAQPAVLIAAGSIALTLSVGSTVRAFPLEGVNTYTPLGLGLGSVVTGWALYRHRLFDIYPVESDTVMTAMRDGVVVANDDGIVTDYNPAGAELLRSANPVGNRLAEELLVDLGGAALERERATAELTAEIDGEQRHFLVDVSPLSQRAEHTGHLLIFRDETTRREQRRELERQSEHMEQFASTVSHDLRNPLKVAESAVELLERNSDSREVDLLTDSLDRMRTIIEESLSFARSGQRIDESETAPVDLSVAAENAWDYVDADDATMTVGAGVTVTASRERLKRLLENLFRNALDHGAADATIRVGPIDDARGFYVADDGPGIPAEKRDDVFDRGFTTEEDGTGFGLAIVDAIAGAHDWEIAVTESADGGARFEVTGCEIGEREDVERDAVAGGT